MQKDFSYPLHIADLNQQEQHYHLVADTEQCKTLAQILQVEDVKSFVADIYLKLHLKEHRLDIWGIVKADIERQSVVSMENFVKTYEAPFEYFYDTVATYKDIRKLEAGINDEVPDIIENGQINLADVAIEQLALVLEDYPRREDERFIFESEFDGETTSQNNPFSVLAKLKKQ